MRDLQANLQGIEPVLNPGTFVFATVPEGMVFDFRGVIAAIHEPEGMSVVITESQARETGLLAVYPCAWITLQLKSDLDSVGLTAAFSTALGKALCALVGDAVGAA